MGKFCSFLDYQSAAHLCISHPKIRHLFDQHSVYDRFLRNGMIQESARKKLLAQRSKIVFEYLKEQILKKISLLYDMDLDLQSSSWTRNGLFNTILSTPISESVKTQIDQDSQRTFSDTVMFSPGSDGPRWLRQVLHAIAVVHPDIGHCQGINFVAGTLLSSLADPSTCFWILEDIIVTKGAVNLWSKDNASLGICIFSFLYALKKRAPSTFTKFAVHPDEMRTLVYQHIITLGCHSLGTHLSLHVLLTFLELGWIELLRCLCVLLTIMKKFVPLGVEEGCLLKLLSRKSVSQKMARELSKVPVEQVVHFARMSNTFFCHHYDLTEAEEIYRMQKIHLWMQTALSLRLDVGEEKILDRGNWKMSVRGFLMNPKSLSRVRRISGENLPGDFLPEFMKQRFPVEIANHEEFEATLRKLKFVLFEPKINSSTDVPLYISSNDDDSCQENTETFLDMIFICITSWYFFNNKASILPGATHLAFGVKSLSKLFVEMSTLERTFQADMKPVAQRYAENVSRIPNAQTDRSVNSTTRNRSNHYQERQAIILPSDMNIEPQAEAGVQRQNITHDSSLLEASLNLCRSRKVIERKVPKDSTEPLIEVQDRIISLTATIRILEEDYKELHRQLIEKFFASGVQIKVFGQNDQAYRKELIIKIK